MKSFVEHMANYAAYHRDPRNILTHLVGVPVIVFSVIVLLSKPSFVVVGYSITPALVAYVLAILFYLRLDILFGCLMALLMGCLVYLAQNVASASTMVWLLVGLGLFTLGWLVQFVGHYYEGKKPAFVDDLVGLLIGPLFVTAEVLFSFGLCLKLKSDIEERVGKVEKRISAHV